MNSLNLHGPLAQTGYGYVTYNIARECIKNNVDLKIFGMGPSTILTQEQTGEINKRVKESIHTQTTPEYNPLAPTLKIWHQNDLYTRIGRGKYLAFPFFELDRFSALEKASLKSPDYLLVSGSWAAQIVKNETGIDARVVNPGVDNAIFFPAQKEDGPYTFINIGKWEVRKGHDVLIEAFNDAFSLKDNVRLIRVNSATNLYSREELERWENIYKLSPMGQYITIINNVKNHHELARLINQADCGVFPSRAEGWNLEILECMSCGLDIITTNYSAHTEYCNTQNSRLIQPEETELAKDGKWFHGQGEWMKFTNDNYEYLIELLRACYNNRVVNEAGIATAENFQWSKTFSQLRACIS